MQENFCLKTDDELQNNYESYLAQFVAGGMGDWIFQS